MTLLLSGFALFSCRPAKVTDCAELAARTRWVEDYALAKSLDPLVGDAMGRFEGAFVDLRLAQGKDALLGGAGLGFSREEIDRLTNRGIVDALELMLARQAVLALRGSPATGVAELKAMTFPQLAAALQTAAADARAANSSGAFVKALPPPGKATELKDALAQYRRFTLARMKDEMAQDPKHAVDALLVSELADEGVPAAFRRFATSRGCKEAGLQER